MSLDLIDPTLNEAIVKMTNELNERYEEIMRRCDGIAQRVVHRQLPTSAQMLVSHGKNFMDVDSKVEP